MSKRNEMAKFCRLLTGDGFHVEDTQGGHIRITHPEIDGPVFAAKTPSDWRSFLNLRAVLKRKWRRGSR